MTDAIYNYNIPLDKYDLLKKIDKNLLNYTIEEIFEIGYSVYVKNFVKKSFELDTSTTMNNITDSKNKDKGSHGENIVYDIVVNKFHDLQVEDMSKKPHSGDINLTFPSKKKMILEVKNYNKTVDIDQVDKLKYDMKYSKINYAIFLSLNSGIVGKKKFELESFFIDGVLSFILYIPYCFQKSIPNKKNIIIHNSYEESINNLTIKIEFAISIIENLSNNINDYKSFENNFYIKNNDIMIEQFNSIYDEFRSIKKSYQKLEENITKNLSSHLSTIKDFEFTIKKKINSLISDKFGSNNKQLLIEKSSENIWNIRFNKKICGRISYLSNEYCVFISSQSNSNEHYNKEFNSFESAKFNVRRYFNHI
jgi:hypothetical protein